MIKQRCEMRGSIVKIFVENFVTYDQLEFYPGPNLNIILGPNGSGKSTMVAAIVLGLGGKPKVLARGSNIGSFVKSGRSSARIEIELNEPNGKNCVICRTITIDSKSTWVINGVHASQKQVEERTRKFKIQVDNLCQFLPQDRVHDFSKMNPQMLLENTEKSVGEVELYELHTQLKKFTADLAVKETKLKNMQAELEQENQRNARVAVDVEKMRQKQILLNCIKHLKEKCAWLKYTHVLEKHTLLTDEKQVKVEEFEKYKKKYQPLLNTITERKAAMQSIQDRVKSSQNETTKKLKVVKDNQTQFEKALESIEDVNSECEKNIQDEMGREAELQVLYQQLNKLENDLVNKEPEQVIAGKIAELESQTHTARDKMIKRIHEREQILSALQNINREIQVQGEQRQRAIDISARRLFLVEKRFPDVYKAVLWLRANKHIFRGEVYEPIILEINVKDPKNAKFFESVIAPRDLQAFTCEYIEDMNKLMRVLRDEKKLRINVLHSGDQHPHSSTYKPPAPIEQLREFGFHSYLADLITAPEPILKYLCRKNGIHKIPLGNAFTNSVFERVPSTFFCFFSDTHRFDVHFSKYSREKSTSTNEVFSKNLLNISEDKQVLQRVEQKLQELEAMKESKSRDRQVLDGHIESEEMQVRTLCCERKKLCEDLGNRRTIHTRINVKQNQIQNMENSKLDVEAERAKCKESIKAIVVELCEIQTRLCEALKRYKHAQESSCLMELKYEDSHNDVLQAERDTQEALEKYKAAEAIVKQCDDQLSGMKQEAKRLRLEALKLSNNIQPEADYFYSIVQPLEEMEKEIHEQQAKADFLVDNNDLVIKEFEARKVTIANITSSIEDVNETLEELKQRMQSVREKWLAPLLELVNRINLNFGKCFAEMGCAGEVLLTFGSNLDDYNLYGLQIKVKYRDDEELQDLDQYLQSGGERSVATAIFMIALQELTHVPFRCVDEINQGMDPINERRVFDLLVNATSRNGTAQYFLLSPKLLPALNYSKHMVVFCVNSADNARDVQFNVDQMIRIGINRKRASLSA